MGYILGNSSIYEQQASQWNVLNRPIDVRFGPADGALYVLDFGYFEMREGDGLDAQPKSGKVWRITKF